MNDDEDLGDHVDQLIVTYNRANAAQQLAEDIMSLTDPVRWRRTATRMADKDFILDDVAWRGAIDKRDKRLGRVYSERLPSTATRVIAAHMMAMAASAYEHLGRVDDLLEESPVDGRLSRDVDEPAEGWAIAETVQRVAELAGYRCEADGLHHDSCPGEVTHETERFFSFHHVFPREEAKRCKTPKRLFDRPSNVIMVFNGFTGLGAGGCHGKIHQERTAARALGLLAPKGARGPVAAPGGDYSGFEGAEVVK